MVVERLAFVILVFLDLLAPEGRRRCLGVLKVVHSLSILHKHNAVVRITDDSDLGPLAALPGVSSHSALRPVVDVLVFAVNRLDVRVLQEVVLVVDLSKI